MLAFYCPGTCSYYARVNGRRVSECDVDGLAIQYRERCSVTFLNCDRNA